MNTRLKYAQKQKNLAYFQNLYTLAFADDRLASEELHFLLQIAHQLNISPKEISKIMSHGKHQKLQIPSAAAERQNQLEGLVSLMMIDQEIHKKEYDLCLRFAEMLGFDKEILDSAITQMS
jgi:uncharacterized tellurite resistance protein B-like protein